MLLLKGRRDSERPGHKYVRRWRDKEGRWQYEYAEGQSKRKPARQETTPEDLAAWRDQLLAGAARQNADDEQRRSAHERTLTIGRLRHVLPQELVKEHPEFQAEVVYQMPGGSQMVLRTHSCLPREGNPAAYNEYGQPQDPTPLYSPGHFTVRFYRSDGSLHTWHVCGNHDAQRIITILTAGGAEAKRSLYDYSDTYQAWQHTERTRQMEAAANREQRLAKGQSPLLAAVEGWEDTVREQSLEVAAIFLADGTVFDQRTGTPDQTMFPAELADAATSYDRGDPRRPVLLTHAHPDNTGLSPADMLMLADWELQEMRCVHDGYVHRITAPRKGWRQKHPAEGTVKNAWKEAVYRIFNEETAALREQQFDPPLTKEDAIERMTHAAATRLAAEFGCTYAREEVPWTR